MIFHLLVIIIHLYPSSSIHIHHIQPLPHLPFVRVVPDISLGAAGMARNRKGNTRASNLRNVNALANACMYFWTVICVCGDEGGADIGGGATASMVN